ncbi:FAD-dependent oxidoreductase [Enterocloster bolteae]|jgi:pyruvate/2-oxoglutarate dehydrogenase complex dihydrolipoamide dehydrogenase (E3) component|uniref:Pyridine nucleotide-disulfide oxidoreductase n=1 Tax=Enterocloster bolteae TaxID=208479 RepID=A0A412Z4W8_9FIRM|nr:FAD-dependent oxidoreductase [Enterocloster bolteae]RGQ59022.1 pyridine nucleotide-disulfide oxidoreductase [Enterocloster bolteae]RGS03986.1 pyridine nucleotide-disulfide oxidoreductase [Enterocloster bolteae]RGV74990.1 pyridine nucleotide-disulfide oxidoreductase [Enterocloster bolteae]
MAENMMENRTKYDAVIIGFGKGGKTMAGALGAAGKKVALIEKSDRMYGGTCINVGCIPTKSLVYRAGLAAAKGGSFEEKAAAYKAAMEQKEDLTARLRGKNYQKLDSNPNITVIDGTASFQSPHVVEVEKDGRTFQVEGEQIFINTGSSAFIPPIEGLKGNPYVYTSEGLLNLTELPSRLVIIGGGYIGVEFSSIYASFGSKVTILQDGDIFLPREDEEIAGAVRESLESRGIRVMTGVKVKALEQAGGKALVAVDNGKEVQKLEAEAVLVATGRRPNTAGLNLEAAGVEIGPRGGIVTDDSLTTTAPHIYAMGDVRGGLQFTYISLDDFRIVKSKVLGDGSYTLKERGAVPYSVFLIPPFSRVGLSEKEAVEKGYKVKVARLAAAAIPKAQVLEQPSGLLKAVIDEETGLILGAHLFCQESYEMINMIKLAMDAKVPYQVLRDTIYTHPTMSEAFNDLFAV